MVKWPELQDYVVVVVEDNDSADQLIRLGRTCGYMLHREYYNPPPFVVWFCQSVNMIYLTEVHVLAKNDPDERTVLSMDDMIELLNGNSILPLEIDQGIGHPSYTMSRLIHAFYGQMKDEK